MLLFAYIHQTRPIWHQGLQSQKMRFRAELDKPGPSPMTDSHTPLTLHSGSKTSDWPAGLIGLGPEHVFLYLVHCT